MKFLDFWSAVIVAITLVLFGAALVVKGVSHDFLLESAVFLVSVKLIVMAYKNYRYNADIVKELREIKDSIRSQEQRKK